MEKLNKYENRVYRNRIKVGTAYDYNPYIKNEKGNYILELEHKVKGNFIAVSESENFINTETGEVLTTSYIKSQRIVDNLTFVKIYLQEVQTLFELKKPSQKLLEFIITRLTPNRDEVFIYVPDALQYCRWNAPNQYYIALRGLIEGKILAQSVKNGFYYINPAVIFNGDRMILMKEYRRQDSKQLELFSNDDKKELKESEF
jgi:hypothetical protein